MEVNCGCPGTFPRTLTRDSEPRAITRSRDMTTPIITPSSTPKIRTPAIAAMAVQNSAGLSRYNLRRAETLNRPRTAISTTAAKIGSGNLLKRPAKNTTTNPKLEKLMCVRICLFLIRLKKSELFRGYNLGEIPKRSKARFCTGVGVA